MLELSIFRVACISAEDLHAWETSAEETPRRYGRMAGDQGRPQWNSRSDGGAAAATATAAAGGESRSSPCTSLKVRSRRLCHSAHAFFLLLYTRFVRLAF